MFILAVQVAIDPGTMVSILAIMLESAWLPLRLPLRLRKAGEGHGH